MFDTCTANKMALHSATNGDQRPLILPVPINKISLNHFLILHLGQLINFNAASQLILIRQMGGVLYGEFGTTRLHTYILIMYIL